MQIYTYLFLDPRNVVQAFEFDECTSDTEAQQRAQAMLRARPERCGVEVWSESSRIAILS